MCVERGLHFFRVDLGAAHIDYPAASPNKIVAVTAFLDHVARIDEAFVVNQRGCALAKKASTGAARAHMDRAIDNLRLDGDIGVDPTRGKPRLSVADHKDHASFGRSVSVLDPRARIKRV